jgi:hypothetical protein
MTNASTPPGQKPSDPWATPKPGRIALAEVRPGDMLLHRGNNKPMRTAIKVAISSPYTHASMYLGDGQGAEATWPQGVRTYQLVVPKSQHIAVFRSQCGFDAQRVQTLKAFVDELVQQKAKYDLKVCAIWKVRKAQVAHELRQFEILEAYFMQGQKPEAYGADGYFCSALLVACYFAVGILSESMACVDRPELHLPEDLGHNVDFGHIVGYLAADGCEIPSDDPFINNPPFHSMFP